MRASKNFNPSNFDMLSITLTFLVNVLHFRKHNGMSLHIQYPKFNTSKQKIHRKSTIYNHPKQ